MLSSRVAIGFPEQRLAYLAEKIAASDAEYCVVLKPGSMRYMGVFRIAEVAALPGSQNRILMDLLDEDRFVDVPPETPLRVIERLLAKVGSSAVSLVDHEDAFVGLVTTESFTQWRLHEERKRTRQLEKQLREAESAEQPPKRTEAENGQVLPFDQSRPKENWSSSGR
jgi:Mg/Co/Ni transporter MgtE